MNNQSLQDEELIIHEHPTWTFKNFKTKEKVMIPPMEFWTKNKFTDSQIASHLRGQSIKGWVFNLKWLPRRQTMAEKAKGNPLKSLIYQNTSTTPL